MTLTLALDYGGREELVAAIRRIAHDVKSKRLSLDAIDEAAVSARLDTALLPDPDLVIRTSGERRVSNFLLWQIAYTELYFTPVRWPDFTRDELVAAFADFATRDRRFGGVSSELGAAPAEADGFVMGELPVTSSELDDEKGPRPC
jgi:undecaprenyl diphosphate synthase